MPDRHTAAMLTVSSREGGATMFYRKLGWELAAERFDGEWNLMTFAS